MDNRNFDKIFFEFPLSSLLFIGEDKGQLDYIISFCIVERAKNYNYLDDHTEKVTEAADSFGVSGSSYKTRINRHQDISNFLNEYISNYGKDSFCRIGKNLVFETRDGGFDFNQFRVLCAISSILGKKKKFVRITYNRIRFAMLGFKSKTIYELNDYKPRTLTDRQIKRLIDILHAKKFFTKFTYARRQIYYSTKIEEDEQLCEAVKSSKLYWAKKKSSIEDTVATDNIKKALRKIREESYSIEAEISKRTEAENKRLKGLRLIKMPKRKVG